MNIYKVIINRRTIRKFQQRKIKRDILKNCLNAARLAPSAANLQPLEYILIAKKENVAKIFKCIQWAGYLKNGAPQKRERPVAYIVIISNNKINKKPEYDVGLAVGNIIFTAFEKGVATCPIGSLDRSKLFKILNIPKNYSIELAIALGHPKQKSFQEEFKGDIRYWLDEKNNLHVPKRKLKDIIHQEKFLDF